MSGGDVPGITMIGSYPSRGCGVSKYISELVGALRSLGGDVGTTRVDLWRDMWGYPSAALSVARRALQGGQAHIQYTPTSLGPLMLILPFLAKLSGIRLIVTAHERPDVYLRHLPKLLGRAFLAAESLFLRSADIVIVHSAHHAEALMRRYSLKDVKVIPHAAGTAMVGGDGDDFKDRHGIEGRTVVFFGAIRPNKGVEVLIEAFSSIGSPGVKLLIAGGTPRGDEGYAARIERLMGESGVRGKSVSIGFVEDEDIPSLMEASDIVVLPYIESTQSGVLLREVVPYRRPAVVSDVGGLGEAAREYGIAITFPPGDADALARGIDRLLDEPSARERIRERQEAYARINSLQEVARRHLAIYREAEGGS